MSSKSHKSLFASGLALGIISASGAVTGIAMAQAPAAVPAPMAPPTTPGNGAPLDPEQPMTPETADPLPDGNQGAVAGSMSNPFSEFDANADGRITRREAQGNATLSSRFKSLDTNNDGALSSKEYSASASASGSSSKRKQN